MPNRLIHETSPYLLHHAQNPVDWYPWGDEALERAKADDKPIFLSVGYEACHWCHVMARESFEDPDTARILNELFVPVKVDREERPDLDDIYMQAVQALSGHGGWPMSVFLTPHGEPFYGGTYFPPEERYGMPAFRSVLRSVAKAWHDQREQIVREAGKVAKSLQPQLNLPGLQSGAFEADLIVRAADALRASYEAHHGGFGRAPKFPQPMTLEALLRAWKRSADEGTFEMITHTLDSMAQGGIYDQVGGGFARYSTDAEWLVPHFEKMLYDNAQLLRLYTHAWQVTHKPLYKRVVAETVEWMLREMRDAAGGFYSSLDADSEGEEGRFYLWSMSEVEDVLGHEDARLVNLYYGLFDGPNFEGHNILHIARPAEDVARVAKVEAAALEAAVARAKPRLLAARERRERPERDEKVLAAWNGLALAGLAEAARVFRNDEWRAAAVLNAEFILNRLRRGEDGRLWRTWKATADPAGQAKLEGYLEDYAFVIEGLLALYQLTFDTRLFGAARQLADSMLAHFADAQWGFFDTADDAQALIVRPKNLQDNAIPAGNSSAALGLLQLASYTGEGRYRAAAEAALRVLAGVSVQYPQAFGVWLCGLDYAAGPVREVAIVGDRDAADTGALLQTAQGPFRPNLVTALLPAGDSSAAGVVPLLAGRSAREGRATAYVCENFACRLPVTGAEELERLLAE